MRLEDKSIDLCDNQYNPTSSTDCVLNCPSSPKSYAFNAVDRQQDAFAGANGCLHVRLEIWVSRAVHHMNQEAFVFL